MNNKLISTTKRTRVTPFSRRVEAAGAKAYTIYNHMLLPTVFDSVENDYWHLCEHVQVWDVSCERQVEVKGPDAAKLVQLMTPRDLRKTDLYQGKYAPICDRHGHILNDPIVIKLAEDRWWISIADSDIKLWAAGLAEGFGFDVNVFEPEVYPLAVQGPKAEQLMSRVFGEEVRSIGFFRGKMLRFRDVELYVARSGWSKQGGFEIYLHRPDLAEPLWDELFAAGCPNGIERIEAGLLSYGSDMYEMHNPFECGLDSFLDLDADIESLSLPALREMADKQSQKLVGLVFPQAVDFSKTANLVGGFDILHEGNIIGEVKSQVWSPRYQKHLAMGMLPLDFLNDHDCVEISGTLGFIHALPFSKVVLEA